MNGLTTQLVDDTLLLVATAGIGAMLFLVAAGLVDVVTTLHERFTKGRS